VDFTDGGFLLAVRALRHDPKGATMTTPTGSDRPVMSERLVETDHSQLFITDHGRDEPAIVAMHGFPDDHRIYDRLVPLLQPARVVTFDWHGYGRSGRSESASFAWQDHQDQITAVLDTLELERVVLVVHDASGPDGVDYALGAPDRISQLVLLNTYYGHAPALHFPEMIRLFADDELAPLADAMMRDENQRLWLLQYTASAFGGDPLDPNSVGTVSVLPQFFGDGLQSDARAAIRAWTRSLFPSLDQQDSIIAQERLASLNMPVTLIFGARDAYLSPELANHLAQLFGRAEVRLVDDASHWPQWDQPETVARLMSQVLE
jgi:pimeloyl-ACP methyl ester carboxylesterase